MVNKRALIIENEPKYIKYYENGINDSKLNFKVEHCEVQKIIDKKFDKVIGNNEYDLFIIDVNISEEPDCELGLEFLKYLKEENKTFKYIVISEFGISNLNNVDLIDDNCFISKVDNQADLIETAIELTINELWD